MAITHVTAVRNGLADYTVDQIDVGTTDANGDLVIATSGDVEVATLACSDPAFGAASSGTASANTISDDTNATGGTAAIHWFQDKDNGEVFRGSVTETGSGGDLQLSSVSIGSGDTVSVDSYSYSAPP